MAKELFLVTGATGMTGKATVQELVTRGHRVRAMVHSEDERSKQLHELGAEVVKGDLLDLGTLRTATKDVTGAYFVYPVRPGLVEASVKFAQASKEAGVKIIVNMSQKPARPDAPSPATQAHWLSETIFEWSGVPTTQLRPTFFAEWLLYVHPMIQQGKMIMPWKPSSVHAPISATDMARMVAGIFENPKEHAGKIYPLYGPTEYSYTEIAALVSRVLGKDVKYEQEDAVKFAGMLGMSENVHFQNHCKAVLLDYELGFFAGTNDLVTKVGGSPQITLEQFVESYRGAFV
jgi:NAD(P)H dehydrogenase (quinone)